MAEIMAKLYLNDKFSIQLAKANITSAIGRMDSKITISQHAYFKRSYNRGSEERFSFCVTGRDYV
jgi:hypothetical protein